jgi:DHA1 family bicyclomycin/chloramphenicol resistance-like MFS transporter
MTKNFTFLLVISLLTCSVEVDISVPSFPDISDYFNISDGLTQMTIALNFFGFCLASGFYGPLSDTFGRRKVMLIGNAIMLVGSIGCALAHSIEYLLFSRFIQGIGASTSAVVAFAMVADVYSEEKSAKLVGTMNSLITVFMSIAPIAGGFINESLGWRGNYSVIAVLSIVSWLMLYLWLPETKDKFNPLSYKKIANDFQTLFTDSRFMLASLVPSIFFAGWMSFVSCGSFLYMETYDLPIMSYALHQGFVIAVFSGVSLYAGQILQTIGEKNCVIFGVVFALVGSILMISVALVFEKAPYLTSISMLIYSIGAAISYPVIFVKSLQIFPDIKGTASSAIMSMRALLCAGFIAFSSYIYSGKLITVAAMLLTASVLIVLFSIKLLKALPFATKEQKLI